MQAAAMTVVETPFFLRKAAGLLNDERSNLVAFLGMNPAAGDVIPGAGGVRKVRWAEQGRGKRGGFRIIYYFHNEAFPLFLLTVYSKNQKANLTKAERNEFQKLIPILVKTSPKVGDDEKTNFLKKENRRKAQYRPGSDHESERGHRLGRWRGCSRASNQSRGPND